MLPILHNRYLYYKERSEIIEIIVVQYLLQLTCIISDKLLENQLSGNSKGENKF